MILDCLGCQKVPLDLADPKHPLGPGVLIVLGIPYLLDPLVVPGGLMALKTQSLLSRLAALKIREALENLGVHLYQKSLYRPVDLVNQTPPEDPEIQLTLGSLELRAIPGIQVPLGYLTGLGVPLVLKLPVILVPHPVRGYQKVPFHQLVRLVLEDLVVPAAHCHLVVHLAQAAPEGLLDRKALQTLEILYRLPCLYHLPVLMLQKAQPALVVLGCL